MVFCSTLATFKLRIPLVVHMGFKDLYGYQRQSAGKLTISGNRVQLQIGCGNIQG